MIKIVGLCIVLFTIYYACTRVVGARRKREELLCELHSLVLFLRDGIALYMRPLPELYAEFEWRHLREYGFPSVLSERRAAERCAELWRDVGEEAKHILAPLLDGLGEHSYTEVIALLDKARERLDGVLEGERLHVGRTRRLAVTLGLSLSLAITILVI